MKHARFNGQKWLAHTFDIQRRDIRCGYLCGAFMLITAVAVRLLSGSPYRIYFLLRGAGMLPPLIFLSLLNLLFTCGMGFACGIALSCRKKYACETKYRAGMLVILLSLCWFAAYPLVFRGSMLAAALFSLCASWFLSLCVMRLYFRIQALSAWITLFFLLWQTYQIIALLSCILWL